MRVAVSCLVAAVFAASSAAQTTINPLAQTGISGVAGSLTTYVGSTEVGGIEALQEITWTEWGDQPCLLKVTYGSFNGGQLGFQPEMDICDYPSSYPPTSSFSILAQATESLASWKTAKFASHPRYFIRGVAVCKTVDNNNRIKGIRIYPAKVWASEHAVEAIDAPDAATRANCGDWAPAAFCPTEFVAVQLVVYHRPHQITGLGLKCRPVEY